MKFFSKKQALVVGAAIAAVTIAAPALANHSWGTYHWRLTGSQVEVPVANNVSGQWYSYLVGANNDWNQSTVIQSPLITGTTNVKNCRAVAGTIQVCSSKYGYTGWLGIASIWLSGGHIVQGTTKLNDSYFASPSYNTPAWRALVTCQEIGHNYGLGHQDENFNTDGTTSCMDYTNVPEGNEHPDNHDYAQLVDIYDHQESSASTPFGAGNSGASAETGDTPAAWGRAIRFTADGRPDLFERTDALGRKVITHVFWAIGEGPRHHD
jgi:hypothetical protein